MHLFSLKNPYPYLILIFTLGLIVRFLTIFPGNMIIGFDQARDLFDAVTIFRDHHLRIIGPTAGNNPNLHHGILWLYYISPPLIFFQNNPVAVALWNSIFNSAAAIIIFYLARQLYKQNLAALIAALIVAVSSEIVQFASWLSNPTVTMFTVPLFFLGLWHYIEGKKMGLVLTALALGLSIQFELFFIYLIPTLIIIFLLLKVRLPDIKLALISLLTLTATLSTMIATEIKFKFAGILSLLHAGGMVGGGENLSWADKISRFFDKFWQSFALNLWPDKKEVGLSLGLLVILIVVLQSLRNKDQKEIKNGFIFVLIYLFSPTIMLLLGYHNAPWFLIGLPPAIALATGYVISKIRPKILITLVVFLIALNNLTALKQILSQGQILLEPDKSALLFSQLKAIDYTYLASHGENFTINSLTNPLYINAQWAYDYYWYGEKTYGYLPTWSGGDQLYPYNILPKVSGDEKYFYLLIDETIRIPISHKLALIAWADLRSDLIEERDFGGILVQKRQFKGSADGKP